MSITNREAPMSAAENHRGQRHRRAQRRLVWRAPSIAQFALVVALACGAALALPPSSALAAGTWSPGVQATLPANAGTNPGAYLAAVSCPSAGNCTTVGYYQDGSGNYHSVLFDESSGTWAPPVVPSVPANAAAISDDGVYLLSCTSAGNCTALGSYNDSSQNTQGLVIGENSGTWGAEVETPLPANAASNPFAFPDSLSCASPGNCSAVGTYIDTSGNQQGLLLDETAGTWSVEEAPLPADAASNPQVFLPSVSCPSAGNCSAVGTYYNTAGQELALTLNESSGTWSAPVLSALPPNPGNYFNVYSVSCPSAGNCTGVGAYLDTSREVVAMLLQETSGTWAAEEAPAPANAATVSGGAALHAISCASVGNCSATGGYIDTSSNDQGLLLDESAGTWSAEEMPMPANASSNPDPVVNDNTMSCPSAGNCAAVGYYNDASGNEQGLLLDETAGTWSAQQAPLPSNAGSNPSADLSSVSCASAGNCNAVGYYYDASGNDLGVLFSEGASSSGPTPSLGRVYPTSGPANATTAVTLTGTQFGHASAVDFGSVPASFTVLSNTSIRAVAPPKAAGPVAITVTTPSGVSTVTAADHFTYQAPAVTNVSPNSGSVTGGTSVTITGTNFGGASGVAFGGVAATSITLNSPTSITAVAPPGSAGQISVKVTATAGTSAAAPGDHFTYVAPAVTHVSPSSGPPAGGSYIIVSGPQLSGASAVDFGSEPAYFAVYSPTALVVLVPPGAPGVVNVRVTTPAGQTAVVAADRYTYT